MTSDVEMQDLAPSMLDHKETIQELEINRGHRKEIHGDDHFAMVGQESEPAFRWIAATPRMSQISGHGALRDLEPPASKARRGSSARPNSDFPLPCDGSESESPR